MLLMLLGWACGAMLTLPLMQEVVASVKPSCELMQPFVRTADVTMAQCMSCIHGHWPMHELLVRTTVRVIQ